MSDELASDLERFRLEWIEETRRTKGSSDAVAPKPGSSTSLPPPAVQSPQSKDEKPLAADEQSPKAKPKVKTALQVYSDAVQAERQGRLNDALIGYRQAFKMDNDIDKLYHRASQKKAVDSGDKQLGLSTTTTTTSPEDFQFERTIQMGPDYDSSREQRSAATVKADTGSFPHEQTGSVTHPSSTAFLVNSLAKSFAENPFVRDQDRSNVTDSRATVAPNEAIEQLDFLPADEDRPVPIARLPRELLLLVLKMVLLSSIIPPAPTAASAASPPTGEENQSSHRPRRHQHHKPRTLREETKLHEDELDIVHDPGSDWRTDVEALERFALTCRYARILTLDDSLWRALCHRTYATTIPGGLPNIHTVVRSQHASDWRRMYIEHARIRFDGTFIAVVTYLRRGDFASIGSPIASSATTNVTSSATTAWTAPSHLITFYRYLRFYASGLVLSLLTTDEPSSIVRQLNPSLRAKGLTIGRWNLRENASDGHTFVECSSLEDPSVDREARKYAFRMTLKLRSTTRGKMNKLDMVSLATENKATGEIEDVPIRPTKPFFFSKVASYAAEDVD